MPEPKKKKRANAAAPPKVQEARTSKGAQPGKDAPFIALAYILSPTIFVPLILYLLMEDKGTERERYHYLQATVFGIGTVLMMFTLILAIIGVLVYIYGIYISYLAYAGKSDDRPLKQYLEQHA
jgi:ABC-type tungstate transport system substrate-binding protein